MITGELVCAIFSMIPMDATAYRIELYEYFH